MTGRYFFRKIIKHISGETYRGFYILSRFHLIHYLTRMCKVQGVPPNTVKANLHILVGQLLEIYFLSSQHAGFHESVMMTMQARHMMAKGSVSSYEENQSIKMKIAYDKLIPIQTSCLELISFLHGHLSGEQREWVIGKYGEIVVLFLSKVKEEMCVIEKSGMSIGLLQSVTVT